VTALRWSLGYVQARPLALLGSLIVGSFVLAAILAPVVAPYGPLTTTAQFRSPPSVDHLFGTDPSGLDVFSRVVFGSRIDLVVGIAGTALSFVVGVSLGLLLGYYRGPVSGLVQRLIDLLQAFPVFVLAMAIVAMAGASTTNVVAVIGILNAPVYMRLVRSMVLGIRDLPVIEAARCVGNGDRRILLYYVLPNAIEPALIQAPVTVGWSILMTASLSFIGAGIPVPEPEWGAMVSVGAPMMITGQWWAALFPGMAIGLCVLGFGFLGETARELMHPERRR
jgi:peptide/nickel transport system permease protein